MATTLLLMIAYILGLRAGAADTVSLSQGVWLFRQAQYVDAEKALLTAVQESPDNEQTHLWLARTQVKLGRLDDSQKTLEAALERLPASADLLYLLGTVFAQEGKTDQAIPCFEKIADQHAGARSMLASLRAGGTGESRTLAEPTPSSAATGSEQQMQGNSPAGTKHPWLSAGVIVAVVVAIILLLVAVVRRWLLQSSGERARTAPAGYGGGDPGADWPQSGRQMTDTQKRPWWKPRTGRRRLPNPSGHRLLPPGEHPSHLTEPATPDARGGSWPEGKQRTLSEPATEAGEGSRERDRESKGVLEPKPEHVPSAESMGVRGPDKTSGSRVNPPCGQESKEAHFSGPAGRGTAGGKEEPSHEVHAAHGQEPQVEYQQKSATAGAGNGADASGAETETPQGQNTSLPPAGVAPHAGAEKPRPQIQGPRSKEPERGPPPGRQVNGKEKPNIQGPHGAESSDGPSSQPAGVQANGTGEAKTEAERLHREEPDRTSSGVRPADAGKAGIQGPHGQRQEHGLSPEPVADGTEKPVRGIKGPHRAESDHATPLDAEAGSEEKHEILEPRGQQSEPGAPPQPEARAVHGDQVRSERPHRKESEQGPAPEERARKTDKTGVQGPRQEEPEEESSRPPTGEQRSGSARKPETTASYERQAGQESESIGRGRTAGADDPSFAAPHAYAGLTITSMSVTPDETRVAFVIGPATAERVSEAALQMCGAYVADAIGWGRWLLRRLLAMGKQTNLHRLPARLTPSSSLRVFSGICANLSWSPDGNCLAFETARSEAGGRETHDVIILRSTGTHKLGGQICHADLASPCWKDATTLVAVRPRRGNQTRSGGHRFNYRDRLFEVPVGGQERHLRLAIPVPGFDRLVHQMHESGFFFAADGLQTADTVPGELGRLYRSILAVSYPTEGAASSAGSDQRINAGRLLRERLCHGGLASRAARREHASDCVAERLLPVSPDCGIWWCDIKSVKGGFIGRTSVLSSKKSIEGMPVRAFLANADESGREAAVFLRNSDEEPAALKGDRQEGCCSCVALAPRTQRVFYTQGVRLLVTEI